MNPAQKFGSMEEQVVFLNHAFEAEGSRFAPMFTFPIPPDVRAELKGRGVDAYSLDLLHFRPATLVRLWKLIGTLEIDVIHWNMMSPIGNPYLWALTITRPGVRHFYTDHNSRSPRSLTKTTRFMRTLKRLLLKRYRQVWCVSQFVQDCLTEQGTWCNLRCCRHFINTDRFRPDPAIRAQMRRQHGVEDRFVVTVIAQLISDKGLDLALHALTQLPEHAVLWIVGTGAQAQDLMALSKKLAVAERVTFWGLKRNVEPFLQASDCFLLPSRWQEAAGLVILEAQSSGVPVVASRVGGIPEYVEEGRTGFLFTPEDVSQLATQLGSLCHDPETRSAMGSNARALALERFSVARRLPELLNLYRNYC